MWATMMAQTLEPDAAILNAINHLLRQSLRRRVGLILSRVHSHIMAILVSRRFKLAALTNNFLVPGEERPAAQETPAAPRPLSLDQLRQSILDATTNPDAKGAPNDALRGLFHQFVESAVEGVRQARSLLSNS